MELKVSSQKPDLLSSDQIQNDDPEEKEISEGEDEDDDRNHKHRRREGQSQSIGGDSPDRGLPRTYRKRNRPFENGNSFREGGPPQSGAALKNNDENPERDFSSRPEKRRPNQAWHQRMRGREPVSWDVRNSRLGMFDAAFEAVQPGFVPSGILGGMGLPNVSNSPNIPWNGFGLFPGISNGVIDAVHPLALPGRLGPAINPPMNIGIPRQRCPDFEERGFCLRGDMCPMEHGFNRIVIEDVQSLSQFNLPVSLPGSQLPGPSGPSLNNDGLGLNSGRLDASDVYDPDQPLWASDKPGPSAPNLGFNQSSNVNETESFINVGPSKFGGYAHDAKTGGSQSLLSASGRIGNVKRSKAGVNEATDSNQGKWTNVAGNGPSVAGSSLKPHDDSVRKQSQKAQRTLFVSGIPTKDNKREALLSHFKKFGEVINIRIPMQSEQAFVQFSRREEAEAALKAPDAVMGNRFIKLFWANRDNITDDVMNGSSSAVPLAAHGVALNPQLHRPLVHVLDKRKENNLNSAGGGDGKGHSSGDNPKPIVVSGPSPIQQKKLENLETLKEELRKKQEMLEQKRNEFQRQLDKLQKQTVGSNDVTHSDSPKALKVEMLPPSHVKPETAKLSPNDSIITASNPTSRNTTASSKEPSRPIQPVPSMWAPIVANRFKLDNRPTSFKVISPLPAGITNVDALKEHFSSFGDVSSVAIEEEPAPQENNDDAAQSHVSARVYFTTRRSAEKAFLHGKNFQGQKMHFEWLTLTKTDEVSNSSANSSVATKTMPSSAERPLKDSDAVDSVVQRDDSKSGLGSSSSS